jgi:hypothetical protein
MLSPGSGRQATSAGWRVFGNAFGPWGLTVQVARPVALALLEISQAVTNTESDRHIDEGGKTTASTKRIKIASDMWLRVHPSSAGLVALGKTSEGGGGPPGSRFDLDPECIWRHSRLEERDGFVIYGSQSCG